MGVLDPQLSSLRMQTPLPAPSPRPLGRTFAPPCPILIAKPFPRPHRLPCTVASSPPSFSSCYLLAPSHPRPIALPPSYRHARSTRLTRDPSPIQAMPALHRPPSSSVTRPLALLPSPQDDARDRPFRPALALDYIVSLNGERSLEHNCSDCMPVLGLIMLCGSRDQNGLLFGSLSC